MSSADFSKLVPGFDFLQGLMKGAGSAVPNISQWIAPTLSPEELSRRIEELRTVQFWLEQNAKLLATTIQALEVQRMTLATLQNMKVPVAQWAEAFKLNAPGAAQASSLANQMLGGLAQAGAALMPGAASPTTASAAPPASAARQAAAKRRAAANVAAAAASAAPAAAPAPAHPMADPMQWWGALTQQFGELAARAMKDSAGEAAKAAAAAAVKQGLDAAGSLAKQAAQVPMAVAKSAAGVAAGVAAGAAKRVASAASKAANPTSATKATKRQRR